MELNMRTMLVSLLFCCFTQAALAFDVSGIPVEPSTTIEQQTLSLNGAGLRTKYFFNIYVAALYVQEPSPSANAVISQPGAKRIQLTLMRGLSAKQLIEALRQGLEQNLNATTLGGLQTRLTTFEKIIDSLHEGRKGDKLSLDFLPGIGTQIRFNGMTQGAPTPGDDFYRALLSIWLGNTPVQDSLKRELLINNH
jgi:hypothetical protein